MIKPVVLPATPTKAVHVAYLPGKVFLKIQEAIYNVAANP